MNGTSLRGLSETDAQARLLSEGFNELPQSDHRTPFRIIGEVVREPMLALLLGAGAVYLVLGDRTEALILLAFATLSVGITVIQEIRTEKVLSALKDLSSPRALVIRDGERKRIAGREVVRGDFIALVEGDRVPADARLVESHDLQTDESLLTGESVAVRKVATTAGESIFAVRPGGDDLPFVFSGSLVVRGLGVAEVSEVGSATEIGRIGQSLSSLVSETPRLQTETRALVRMFGAVGGTVSLLAVVLYGTMRGGWLDAVLAGIALGMSMLPEELPLVLTVFMAMGAWRISQARVLARRATAIETLGSATVLCTDKTGTLTQNRMIIAELRLPGGDAFRPASDKGAPSADFQTVLEFGILSSALHPTDPMELAFQSLQKERLPEAILPGATSTLLREYGLRPELLAMTHVWKPAAGAALTVAAKGAPEAIARLCRLAPEARTALDAGVNNLAGQGMRVLAVARGSFDGLTLPESQTDFVFSLVGLVGLADPLRPGVPDAVNACRSAGVRVVMITGDYPTTAQVIARQAGFFADEVLTGEAMAKMSDEELALKVRTATVFARVLPEQKLRIVRALKANHEVVAMTGDGVNDAPSLKAAHIGIAMGGRGTDVAREASSMVLLDDDFGSIVKAIRLGRRIFDNLQKAMGFIFAVHVPIAGLALLPLPFGLPILFGPVHIALLEMVIDPVCSLVFEAETEEKDIMGRPPRDPATPLFGRSMILWSVVQGAVAFAIVAGIFVTALNRGMPADEVRALTFFALVLNIVALIFANRSFSGSLIIAVTQPNQALVRVLPAVFLMMSLSLLWPRARVLLHFQTPRAGPLAIALASSMLLLLLLEAAKTGWQRRSRS
ncbi:MAG: cation-translocating P-type ATPase [Vicinamibacteria bacterium]